MQKSSGKVWEEAKKKEGGSRGSGSLMCFLVVLQSTTALAGQLIACRCNNMRWSRQGWGVHSNPQRRYFCSPPLWITAALLTSAVCVCKTARVCLGSICNNPRRCSNSCHGNEFVLSEVWGCWTSSTTTAPSGSKRSGHKWHNPSEAGLGELPKHSRQGINAFRFKPPQ